MKGSLSYLRDQIFASIIFAETSYVHFFSMRHSIVCDAPCSAKDVGKHVKFSLRRPQIIEAVFDLLNSAATPAFNALLRISISNSY